MIKPRIASKKNDVLTPEMIRRRFSNFFNAYAKAINKRYNRTGSLFQERFRRKEITNIQYYTALIGYIITNALKNGLVKRANEYPYCAYHAIVSKKPALLLRNEIIAWFCGEKQFVDYINSYEIDIVERKLFLESELDD